MVSTFKIIKQLIFFIFYLILILKQIKKSLFRASLIYFLILNTKI